MARGARRPRLLASVLPGLEDVAARAAAESLGAKSHLSGPGWVALDLPSLSGDLRSMRAAAAVHAWVRHVEGDYSTDRRLPELRRRLRRTSFGEALKLWRAVTGRGAPKGYSVVCSSAGSKVSFFELQRTATEAFSGGALGLPGGAEAEASVFVAAGAFGAVVGLRLFATEYLVEKQRPRRSVPPSFWGAVAAETRPGPGPVLLLGADEDLALELRALSGEAPLVICHRRSRELRGMASWAARERGVARLRSAPDGLPLASGAASRGVWVVGGGDPERVWAELGRVIGSAADGPGALVVVGHDTPALSYRLARQAGFEVRARHKAQLGRGELHLLALEAGAA